MNLTLFLQGSLLQLWQLACQPPRAHEDPPPLPQAHRGVPDKLLPKVGDVVEKVKLHVQSIGKSSPKVRSYKASTEVNVFIAVCRGYLGILNLRMFSRLDLKENWQLSSLLLLLPRV